MNKHRVLGYIFLGVVFAGFVGAIYWWQYGRFENKNSNNDKEVCIQVIQKARNPQTGEVKEFPTPCDVPAGWDKIATETPDTIYCGGFAGTPCPEEGYKCVPEGSYPDAATICKKE